MPLKAVEKYQYAQMVTDILDKILMTSRRGIHFVIRALSIIVLRNKRIPKHDPIPQAIIKRAQEIRELIEDRDIWIPFDPSQEKNGRYQNRRSQEQREFTNIVKRTVEGKIESLRWMSSLQRRQLITSHRKKRNESLQPKPSVTIQRPMEKNVESDEYVELRNQWRLNLMYPFEGENGLNEDEMSRLACLVDTEKYSWIYAQLLTTDLTLAHWLSKKNISQLALDGILDINNASHLPIMTEPTDEEMARINLLSPFLKQGLINVEAALKLKLEETDYELLQDEDFQMRAQGGEYTENDLYTIWGMGISTDNLEKQKRRVVGLK